MATAKGRYRHGGIRKVCECPRERWPRCAHPWHLMFKWRGIYYRFSLDKHCGHHLDTKADALTEADKVRTEIRAGRFVVGAVPPPSPDVLLLRALCQSYVER